LSEDTKRVGVVSGIEIWRGEVKCRKVAVARLTFTEDADEASSLVVGMQGLSEAIDWRRRRRGSCSEADIVARVRIDTAKLGWDAEVSRLGDIACELSGKLSSCRD
jgi:hypothetical protein